MHYHEISVLVFWALLFAVSIGSLAKQLSPPWDDMHTKHSWGSVPTGWEDHGHPPSGTTINLYVALQPHHEDALIDALYEVSEPEHPRYGKHLTKEQVAELVAPHPETLELVNSWLDHHEIPPSSISMTHGGGTLTLKGVSMTQANTLLGASYRLYRHVETNESIVRTVGYALPMVLHEHVLTVAPTTSFVPAPRQWQRPQNSSGGTAGGPAKPASGKHAPVLSSRLSLPYVTVPFLRWLYHTNAYQPASINKNMLGIVGFLGDYPNPSDLTAFMRKNRIDGLGATYKVVPVNGGSYNPNTPHIEANFDIQLVEAMAYPTPVTFYSSASSQIDTNDMFLPWLGFIIDQETEDIPQTISISYFSDELSNSKAYAFHVCRLFGQLGARGVSVLFASGDDGVGPGNCKLTDGSVKFKPKFPPTCCHRPGPFITAVGGTTLYNPEVGSTLSGGGFSYYFPRPLYQQEVMKTFLRGVGNQYQGLYNPRGRGIPDISAQSVGFNIFLNGKEQMTHGTSGSSPIVAAIIALLNDYRITNGQRPLGMLNGWLYGSGRAAFNDITSGRNPGCGTNGFSAVPGWDAVTGLGTPDFLALLARLPGEASSSGTQAGSSGIT